MEAIVISEITSDEEHDNKPEELPKKKNFRTRNKDKENAEILGAVIRKVPNKSLTLQIKNEEAYDNLIKMGEANELCKTLGKNRTYRVFNKANGDITCFLYEGNKREKELKFPDLKRE